MDYQKTESLGHEQGGFPHLELSKNQDLRSKEELGELGRQAIFSESQVLQGADNITPEADMAGYDNNQTPGVEIVDQPSPEKSDQGTPMFFQPSVIRKNGENISPATLSVLKEIEENMANNPATAVANFQEARRLYNQEGKAS